MLNYQTRNSMILDDIVAKQKLRIEHEKKRKKH